LKRALTMEEAALQDLEELCRILHAFPEKTGRWPTVPIDNAFRISNRISVSTIVKLFTGYELNMIQKRQLRIAVRRISGLYGQDPDVKKYMEELEACCNA